MRTGVALGALGLALLAARAPAATPVPAAAPGPAGPAVVAIDGGHHNYHTREGRFAPFAALLERQGFRVNALAAPFGADSLAGVDVLVIANALDGSNVDSWALPTPSAFSDGEVSAVAEWVRHGGALLLIADHFPFPGAAQALASAFGFEFLNGFAIGDDAGTDRFSLEGGTLREHAITRGRVAAEGVSAVATFTGSAFRAPPGAQPLLVLPGQFFLLLPSVAWQFDDDTPAMPAAGLLQGAVLRHGAGRVAVFAEASMFTAQVGAGDPAVPIGFNAPGAEGNAQFVVNTLLWLAGLLPE